MQNLVLADSCLTEFPVIPAGRLFYKINIRENKIFQIPNIMQTAKGEGMITMENSIKTLIAENKISPSITV
jgi:Tfp pilus assembly pilus retraction ATPase PilT